MWEFVPAGSQYKNGLTKARVKATKSFLKHVLDNASIAAKPIIKYTELTVLLARVANVIND